MLKISLYTRCIMVMVELFLAALRNREYIWSFKKNGKWMWNERLIEGLVVVLAFFMCLKVLELGWVSVCRTVENFNMQISFDLIRFTWIKKLSFTISIWNLENKEGKKFAILKKKKSFPSFVALWVKSESTVCINNEGKKSLKEMNFVKDYLIFCSIIRCQKSSRNIWNNVIERLLSSIFIYKIFGSSAFHDKSEER